MRHGLAGLLWRFALWIDPEPPFGMRYIKKRDRPAISRRIEELRDG